MLIVHRGDKPELVGVPPAVHEIPHDLIDTSLEQNQFKSLSAANVVSQTNIRKVSSLITSLIPSQSPPFVAAALDISTYFLGFSKNTQ
jgi:hypothetical protein